MKFRRWFRFNLRTLLVLLTFLGVAFGWLSVQVKWIRDRHRAVDRLRLSMEEGVNAPWSLRIFGEPGYKGVYIVIDRWDHPTADERRIKREIEPLFPEADVQFSEEMRGMSGGFPPF